MHCGSLRLRQPHKASMLVSRTASALFCKACPASGLEAVAGWERCVRGLLYVLQAAALEDLDAISQTVSGADLVVVVVSSKHWHCLQSLLVNHCRTGCGIMPGRPRQMACNCVLLQNGFWQAHARLSKKCQLSDANRGASVDHKRLFSVATCTNTA